jgi:hypothetical protein
MKKLFLGVIATVMFGSLGFGKNINPIIPKLIVLDLQKENAIKTVEDGNVATCFNVAMTLALPLLEIEVSERICCGCIGGCGCWNATKPFGHIFIDGLSKDLQNAIKDNNLNSIEISKSGKGTIDGRSFTVIPGKYSIETSKDVDGGAFITVMLNEVK